MSVPSEVVSICASFTSGLALPEANVTVKSQNGGVLVEYKVA